MHKEFVLLFNSLLFLLSLVLFPYYPIDRFNFVYHKFTDWKLQTADTHIGNEFIVLLEHTLANSESKSFPEFFRNISAGSTLALNNIPALGLYILLQHRVGYSTEAEGWLGLAALSSSSESLNAPGGFFTLPLSYARAHRQHKRTRWLIDARYVHVAFNFNHYIECGSVSSRFHYEYIRLNKIWLRKYHDSDFSLFNWMLTVIL